MSKPLTHILNLCFLEGVFPDGLKTAHVKAIYKKKDDSNNIKKYPVSLLSNICKTIENVIYGKRG